MKKLLIIVILFMTFYEVQSQINMVNNPSFENPIHLPYDLSGRSKDQVMNCLCDRGTNTFMTYPDESRYEICIGWYNTSYGHEGSTPDYFHEDVDPTDSNNTARQADVPVNYCNAVDINSIPLVPQFLTYAHDGKAYIGIGNARYKGTILKPAPDPWSEVVSQKLNNPIASNYLKEGRNYDVSFWVARANPHVFATGHSLKRISAYFTEKRIRSNEPWVLHNVPESEHELYMIEDHNTPGGFLTDTNWTQVSGTLTAQKDLFFINIGSFDVPFDFHNGGNNRLYGDLVTPDTIQADSQKVYYYIDDVSVIDAGPATGTCDCSALDIEVEVINVRSSNPNHCCTIAYAKVIGQNGNCKLQEFRWRNSLPSSGSWVEVDVTDIFDGRFNDTTFIPLDTFCTDSDYEGLNVDYMLEFRTFGEEFGCRKDITKVFDCDGIPCNVTTFNPDYNDSTKTGVRLESRDLGRNGSNQCCFEIVLINNTPFPIEADRISFLNESNLGPFINTNIDLDFTSTIDEYFWDISEGGIAAFDTITLGEICIDDSSTLNLGYNIKLKINNLYENCFLDGWRKFELNCSVCCPNFELDYTMIVDTSGCCMQINGFDDGGCGDSIKYYLIDDSIAIEQTTLPFEVCESNSDMKIRIDILDELDNVICIKEYDFEKELLGCSCCKDIVPIVLEDPSYEGTGCRFVLDRISNSENCSFDSTITVEFGYVDSTGYNLEGSFDYDDYSDWYYDLDNCEKKTIAFKFYRGDELVCEKEIELFCQNCEDLDIEIEGSQIETIQYQGEIIPTWLCCIEINYSGSGSDSCLYTGLITFLEEDLPNKIDSTVIGLENLGSASNTFKVCTPIHGIISGPDGSLITSIRVAFGIYNANGDLVCSYSVEDECLTGATNKSTNENNSIKESNILVTRDKLNVDFNKTDKLDYFILNLSGQIVERKIYNDFNSDNIEFDLSNLNSGIYFININTDENTIVKMIKIAR